MLMAEPWPLCQQHGGVQPVIGRVMLLEDALVIDPVLQDVGLDLVRGRTPRGLQTLVAPDPRQVRGAIHRHQHISFDDT